jgi:hypothetical protein
MTATRAAIAPQGQLNGFARSAMKKAAKRPINAVPWPFETMSWMKWLARLTKCEAWATRLRRLLRMSGT